MTAKQEAGKPESTQQYASKTAAEILRPVNTQRKVDSLVLALLSKKNRVNPNITEKE